VFTSKGKTWLTGIIGIHIFPKIVETPIQGGPFYIEPGKDMDRLIFFPPLYAIGVLIHFVAVASNKSPY